MSDHDEVWAAGTPCWVDYGAPEVEAAKRFYGDLLGWSYSGGEEEWGGYLMCEVRGRAAAGMGPQQDPSVPPSWTLYFATDDADATAAAVREAGGAVLAEPFDVGPMGRMAICADPQGTVFGIWQAGLNRGMAVANEPGAVTWEDGYLADGDAARDFYGRVFGFVYGTVEMAGESYTTFALPGSPDHPLGGLGMPPADGEGSQWRVYFAVESTSRAVEAVRAGGGEVLAGPDETPWGHLVDVRDPWGARFFVMGGP